MNKSILDVVHETALDLHEASAMKLKTLREIESLCLPPVKQYSANQIRYLKTHNEHTPNQNKHLNCIKKLQSRQHDERQCHCFF
ncbi:MAG TPA: hypothetical protein DCM38_14150 [Gammaproteobacteria bacterium]|nr:hypothetical protein [Candidatus Parabeggiatoa sp.]HAI70565.1 hypothetical protein [Gammaproteobacteria bacterium]